jgi:hypothetical protein
MEEGEKVEIIPDDEWKEILLHRREVRRVSKEAMLSAVYAVPENHPKRCCVLQEQPDEDEIRLHFSEIRLRTKHSLYISRTGVVYLAIPLRPNSDESPVTVQKLCWIRERQVPCCICVLVPVEGLQCRKENALLDVKALALATWVKPAPGPTTCMPTYLGPFRNTVTVRDTYWLSNDDQVAYLTNASEERCKEGDLSSKKGYLRCLRKVYESEGREKTRKVNKMVEEMDRKEQSIYQEVIWAEEKDELDTTE